MARWTLLGLMLAAVLAGCGPQAEQPEQTALETAELPVAAAELTATPTEAPPTSVPVEPTEPSEEPTSLPVSTAAPIEAAAPTVTATTEAAEPASTAMFGSFGKTYFRGRADAPITMIDHSDFL